MIDALAKHRGFTASLHRLLIRRVLGMTVVVCALLGVGAYLHEFSRYDEAILANTLHDAEDFRQHILAHLDTPDLGEGRNIQAALDALPPRRHRDDIGRVVYVRIMDTGYRDLAQRFVPGFAYPHEVLEHMAGHHFPFSPGGQSTFREIVRIGDRPYVHLGIIFTNSRGQSAAYVEAIYAVSDKMLAELAAGTLRTVAMVVLVVLATTLLFYPVVIRLLRRVTALSVHLQEANLETLRVLGSAIAKRDSDTDQHNYRVTIYSVRLAEALGLEPSAIRSLIKGAMLHDVGKIGIRDAILLKPGALADAEYREMQKHIQHGRDIVAQASWLRDAVDVISGHHERYDGGGYDHGSANGAIPLCARLFAVVDVFDALTSHRPYKEPIGFDQAMSLMKEDSGRHFDPVILDAFAGIARNLYDSTVASDDAQLKDSLRRIFQAYFTGDIAVMMEGVEELVTGRQA
ncbi:MAG: hypothetical protein A2051_03200 [Desulfovibrionales bacterium GWA2_65_9]|nr:MAG: hypothetical protein A2051_03200 [Desulfovibrionales bacterium GWA2_65_9]